MVKQLLQAGQEGMGAGCWEAETITFLQPLCTRYFKFVNSQKHLLRLKPHSEAVEVNKALKTFVFMIYESS